MYIITILEGIGGFIAFMAVAALVVLLLQGLSNITKTKIVSRSGNTIVEPTRKVKHNQPVNSLNAFQKLKMHYPGLYDDLKNGYIEMEWRDFNFQNLMNDRILDTSECLQIIAKYKDIPYQEKKK